ncbi:MAG TPA: glucoamylase family protein [Dermatophilaceae bacterium]|nr:glucoamylase family protein [Dermatophilaceae bacterium]
MVPLSERVHNVNRGWWGGRSRDPWTDRQPIRSEIFGPERFDDHAVSLADSQTIVSSARPVVSLLQRLHDDADALVAAYESIVEDVQAQRTITPAAEWLVDNFHTVESHVRQIRQDLPPGYFRQLPKLGPGFLEGHPRIFGIVWAYVAHTDSLVDPDLLGRYIRAYENRKALTLGELWAVAISLRLLLIENIRRLTDLVVAAGRDRHRADELADRLLGLDGHPARPWKDLAAEQAGARTSRGFAVQLMRRLSGEDLAAPMEWLAARLAARGIDPETAVYAEHQGQASATVTMRNIFTSLRLISDLNWEDWLESVSLIEDDLRSNPGYAALDFQTRNLYRCTIEELARGAGQEEIDVTRAVLYRAAHAEDEVEQDIGYWLIDDGREGFAAAIGYRPPMRQRIVRLGRRLGLGGYLSSVAGTGLALLAVTLWLVSWLAGGLPWGLIVLLGALAVIPLSDLALGLVNYASARLFHASIMPALALRDGVPEHLRTLVTIPTMLTSHDGVEEMVELLEVHFLANSFGEVYFALVTDWADSDVERTDADQELLEHVQRRVGELNERHGYRFFLFHRERRWNPAEGVWMGWERKRGKLEELNRLLRGAKDTSFMAVEGRLPGRFQYILTLDSDTRLPREAARRLVAKISHPLNRPRYEPRIGRVTRGYGILQPRVSPSLPMSEGSSAVQRIYSTPRGLDPYAFAVSDVYQDLFDEGSFAGKGIYDIDTVQQALEGRVPENTLLSHDLLEGNYARSGLVTDVEVVEEYPMSYAVAAFRQHRWVRGDWQLLPWLTIRRHGLSHLGRWKMLDNLRRSLSPIFLILGLLFSVAVLPARAVLAWYVLLLATFFVPPLLPLVPRLLLRRAGVTLRSRVRTLVDDIRSGVVLGAMNLVLLSHQAWMMGDAIVRTLIRMLFTRRHLLEWTTAAAAQHAAKGSLADYVRVMRGGFVAPIAVLVLAAWRGWGVVAVVALPALAWLAAPVIARWASRPSMTSDVVATPEELAALRLVARRTWLFFETFVTAKENHLPPDNFQEEPQPIVAHRTSPTNIGLYLLTTVSARDFGWIGMADAVERLAATMATLGRLKYFRGHLFNWYDTQTLAALHPTYVSTVDSGNLAGHLIALANVCQEWRAEPGRHARPADGVLDAIALVRQHLADLPDEPDTSAARRRLTGRLDLLADLVAPSASLQLLGGDLDTLAADARDIVADAEELRTHGADADIAVWARAVERSLDSHRRDAALTEAARRELEQTLGRIEAQARRLVTQMDFAFLHDARRSLLSIGYQVAEDRLDDSHYDLLASEARLASYVAIAKGDVRTRHWFLLGRSVTAVGGGAALLSWSGSMFEYLMPPLVMRAPSSGLLHRTAQLVVRRQITYAAALGVPWGISESAYNARDLDFTYQYSPFGVPGLGLVRGLANNVVIAPYATGLAAMIDPSAAVENYARLARLRARGRYGYYEAIDFTPTRVPKGEDHAVIRCYMAHHQGMTIVAIHNAVRDGVMRDRFHAEAMVKATELLLQERAPREVPISHARSEELDPSHSVRSFSPSVERRYLGLLALQPAVHHLSNGRLSLTLTPSGGSQLRWKGVSITRWHPDPTTDGASDYVFLKGDSTGRVWSATSLPLPGRAANYEVRFAEDRADVRRRRGSITTELEYHLSPEADAVVRRLTIRNDKRGARRLSVMTYAELVLANARDDDAHPAFSKLFVHTEFLPDKGAIIATRRRRTPSDPEVWAGHMVYVESGALGQASAETDRARFLGRGNTIRTARMLGPDAGASGTTGYVLDPIFSLTQRVRVPGQGMARLHLWTFAASSREEMLALIDRHRSVGAFTRAAMLAWTQSQVQLRHLGIEADEAGRFQRLAGHVLFPHPALRPPSAVQAMEAGPQSALWPLGISGDLPIVVVRIDDDVDLDVVRELIRAFEFWRLKRFAVDLVVLNERSSSYVQELHRALEVLATSIRPRTGAPDSTGRVYLVRADQTAGVTLGALNAAARVVIVAQRGDLSSHLARAVVPQEALRPPPRSVLPAGPPMARPFPPGGLLHFNGYGGFSGDGREYVTVLDAGQRTPAPWTNVVANEDFGFHATAEGAGYTWWRNSRDNQLTPWRNDPVSAPVSEVIYVRDQTTGVVATPTAAPIDTGRHLSRHGFGYTSYQHDTGDLALELTQFVPLADPVKLSRLTVTNHSAQPRSVAVTWYGEFLLGMNRSETAPHLITEYHASLGVLLVRNPWSTQFPDQVVFVDFAGTQTSWTGDRREFLGQQGTVTRPAAVFTDQPLSGEVGAGLDPCGAMQQVVVIDAGATVEVVVAVGAATDVDGVRTLVQRYRSRSATQVLAEVRQEWTRRLGTVRVSTPDPSFDVMLNGWLLYQTLACRMLARSGYYQASGAYGFRDQLQDSMAIVLIDPATARSHILRAAGRQFPEGDVQHWWLPANGMGVRTRISDDVVWLAHATARYITVTGDMAVLDERIPFLSGPLLGPQEHEAFFGPGASAETATLYQHCIRGLNRAFEEGSHGLPLMGTGDWNDGMNRVGINGNGESVWLGWFLHTTLSAFIPLARARGDAAFADQGVGVQARLLAALEGAGWDGSWYRRAYFDDGTPLGAFGRSECRIDAIAQSWAVLSGAARPERAVQAMDQVEAQLVMAEQGVARLFTPPFDVSEPDPGYIRAYPPGVRENGGQYTHGATWSILAYAALDRQDRAGWLFSLVNPVNHALTREQADVYRVEPYVVAADVYSVAPHVGRGGWTWYTGSSGWMYRAGLEAVLGLRREGSWLVVAPCLPPEWTHAQVSYTVGQTSYDIAFEASASWPRRVTRIELDGYPLAQTDRMLLAGDGRAHRVRIVLDGPGPRVYVRPARLPAE